MSTFFGALVGTILLMPLVPFLHPFDILAKPGCLIRDSIDTRKVGISLTSAAEILNSNESVNEQIINKQTDREIQLERITAIDSQIRQSKITIEQKTNLCKDAIMLEDNVLRELLIDIREIDCSDEKLFITEDGEPDFQSKWRCESSLDKLDSHSDAVNCENDGDHAREILFQENNMNALENKRDETIKQVSRIDGSLRELQSKIANDENATRRVALREHQPDICKNVLE